MTQTLPTTVHEHHDALIPHVDALASIADPVGTVPADELAARIEAESRFLRGQLVPHMRQAEATVYPALERMLQNRHSMTPMRREHETIVSLVSELDELAARAASFGVQLRLRRVLFRMYALLKVHLAEEDAYIGILERNLSPEEAADLAAALTHATADQPI
jgi:hypothetical protein